MSPVEMVGRRRRGTHRRGGAGDPTAAMLTLIEPKVEMLVSPSRVTTLAEAEELAVARWRQIYAVWMHRGGGAPVVAWVASVGGADKVRPVFADRDAYEAAIGS